MKKFLLLLLVLVVIGAVFGIYKNNTKNKSIALTKDIKIAGVSYRTTNNNLMSSALMQEAIAKVLRMEFLNLSKDAKFYIVYSDYSKGFASDFMNKEFTTHVGFEVESFEGLDAEKFSFITIKAGEYKKFITEFGLLNEVVIQKWQEIWQDEKLLKKRNFKTDFEVYTDFKNNNGKAEIYIGIN